MTILSEKLAWREKADCFGRPIDDYAPRDHERTEDFFKRVDVEKVCPSSCPVRRECAREALLEPTGGVIRAGVLLPLKEDFSKAEYKKLIEVAKPIMSKRELKLIRLSGRDRNSYRIRHGYV